MFHKTSYTNQESSYSHRNTTTDKKCIDSENVNINDIENIYKKIVNNAYDKQFEVKEW